MKNDKLKYNNVMTHSKKKKKKENHQFDVISSDVNRVKKGDYIEWLLIIY